ncbi:hypothetical protein D9V37_05005 [Nocardioides mangrovicus]|uniref:DUF998 domain-containing protein n=1 Tax=Nocardioides mangrovicus TaxID=2478913 RepID=A0A3L8P703_9ACTN|nr:hypothetical protein [Nocardioides mangrovicus]RLV50409.1 hypothetical protein D9V37_05005 [Nocardioides mangrovicus]
MTTTRAPTVTYRYLRVALVVLPVLLGAAVVLETVRSGCVLDSISAYVYTPAQHVFVGALVAIGVCLVVIKGTGSAEDVLLNLAGMMAPLVALVPTPYVQQCGLVEPSRAAVRAEVANGFWSLVVAALAVAAAAVVVAARTRTPTPTPVFRLGRAVGVGVAVLAVVVFLADRDRFDRTAHYAAALVLFGCIIAVALIKSHTSRHRRVNGYSTIAALMLLTLPAGLVAGLVAHWSRTVLGVEVALIALFVAFWLLETKEHWHDEGAGMTRELA